MRSAAQFVWVRSCSSSLRSSSKIVHVWHSTTGFGRLRDDDNIVFDVLQPGYIYSVWRFFYRKRSSEVGSRTLVVSSMAVVNASVVLSQQSTSRPAPPAPPPMFPIPPPVPLPPVVRVSLSAMSIAALITVSLIVLIIFAYMCSVWCGCVESSRCARYKQLSSSEDSVTGNGSGKPVPTKSCSGLVIPMSSQTPIRTCGPTTHLYSPRSEAACAGRSRPHLKLLNLHSP